MAEAPIIPTVTLALDWTRAGLHHWAAALTLSVFRGASLRSAKSRPVARERVVSARD